MTAILRMRFSATDYDEWKKMFDSDRVDRKGNGVTEYRILRSVEDPNDVIVDLVFGTPAEASNFEMKLRHFWAETPGVVPTDTRLVVATAVEERTL